MTPILETRLFTVEEEAVSTQQFRLLPTDEVIVFVVDPLRPEVLKLITPVPTEPMLKSADILITRPAEIIVFVLRVASLCNTVLCPLVPYGSTSSQGTDPAVTT